MKSFLKFLTLILVLAGGLEAKSYKHNIQLQVADSFCVPIDNTQFWVTIDIVKNGNEVTLYFPALNFQVGQCSEIDPSCSVPSGGYLITSSGFLPEDIRPKIMDPITVVVGTENGPLAFSSNASTPPNNPPAGYLAQVFNTGNFQIQATQSVSNQLPPGPQVVAPFSISYIAESSKPICKNFKISDGFTNVSQFTGSTPHGTPAGDNIRDSHINDAYNGVLAWAWSDNHGIDPTANILNLYVAIGKTDKNGNVRIGKPVQITNLPVNTIVWDTSIAINRTDTDNIVVSYSTLEYDFNNTYFDGNIKQALDCRAVSFDGGKTWGGIYDGVTSLPNNGPLNYQPPGGQGSGDYPGVLADKYGNFWIGSTDLADASSNSVNVPYLLISSDQGVTWNLAYEFPPVVNPQPPEPDGGTNGDSYDYPHLAFGGDGLGNYGIWYYADYIVDELILGDLYPAVAFVPITGLDDYGSGSVTFLNVFPNTVGTPVIGAANDGRFWSWGESNYNLDYYDISQPLLYKSPGALNANWAGPWSNGYANVLINLGLFEQTSVPFYGYFGGPTVQGLVYDEQRQALYALLAIRTPETSQNMRIFFTISRNNGSTWSRVYDISTTAFANRGFTSMALDPVTGDLAIGWYDGRNDKTETKIQYFGAVVKSCVLDELVKGTPYSDPVFVIPDQGIPVPPDADLGS